jgi:hypothetical protein
MTQRWAWRCASGITYYSIRTRDPAQGCTEDSYPTDMKD